MTTSGDLALAVRSCVDPMLLVDGEGRVSALNPAAERLGGVAPLIEQAVRDHPKDITLHVGPDRILEGSVSPIDGAGRALVVLRDVTERRRAERAARESEVNALKETELALEKEQQFSKLVIDTTPTPIFVKDEEGRYLLVNKALAEMLGMSADSICGKTARVVTPGPGDHDKVDEADQEVVRTLRPVRQELTVTLPSGEARAIQTTKVPLIEPGGAVRVLGISIDVTERRDHERVMAATIAELERRRQAMSDQLSLIKEQQDLIEELGTPILEVAEGVVALPVIGAMDEARAAEITAKLLAEIAGKRARYAIIDVTGMSAGDAGVAARLTRLSSAIRLLGAEGIITGIQPAMARSMAELGAGLHAVSACATLRDGLDLSLRAAGQRHLR